MGVPKQSGSAHHCLSSGPARRPREILTAVGKSLLIGGITPAPGSSLALSDGALSCDALWVLEPR